MKPVALAVFSIFAACVLAQIDVQWDKVWRCSLARTR